jgi:signal transduction histidine kinase
VNNIAKILIVDDDPLNILFLRNILKSRYEVRTADCGENALDIVPVFRPDLVLLDVVMTNMNGYEVTRRIRAHKKFRFIKIILVSGQTMLEERLQGYEAGADDFVTKPFVEEELLAKVEVFLRLKHTEELDRLKDDLLRLFSHETRTPLNAIIGLSDLHREDEDLAPRIINDLNVIYDNGQILLNFVRKTATICTLKEDVELYLENRSLVRQIQSLLLDLEDEADEKNVHIEFVPTSDVKMNLDWSYINKAIEYVIENAIKFSPENGNVTIQIDNDDEFCSILISDNGMGVKPEWKDSIFDEFAIQDVMHHQKGQGLSLAIARYSIEHHNGTIDVESEYGNGATFIIKLPVSPDVSESKPADLFKN